MVQVLDVDSLWDTRDVTLLFLSLPHSEKTLYLYLFVFLFLFIMWKVFNWYRFLVATAMLGLVLTFYTYYIFCNFLFFLRFLLYYYYKKL